MERRTFITSAGALGAGTLLSSIISKDARGASPENGLLSGQNGSRSAKTVAKPLDTESGDLSPYTGAWGDAQIRHLLRRSMFGVPESQFLAAQALGSMDAVVNQLLAASDLTKVPLPAKFAAWLDNFPATNLSQTDQMSQSRLMAMEMQEIQNWWFDLMMQENLSIRQKMTLMWTNHFVTGSSTVNIPSYVYTYLMTCMQYALGNFKDFAYAISIDPAMLVYLNGNQNYVRNKKSFINENYAREVMELFTLGINFPNTDIPNYTQDDVENNARAVTGWQPTQTAPFVGQFNSALHDTTDKTFLGQTGNWALQDILNIIFQQPTTSPVYPPNGPTGFPQGYTSAYWVCQKLYKEFVYYVPNPSVVDAMARLMITSNFEIAPVMQALLTSAHFYDANVIGAQIKSPVEYMGSLIREFGLTYPAFNPEDPPVKSVDGNGVNLYTDSNPILSKVTVSILNQSQGQELLNPPNVAGWPGGENWLSAGSFQGRENYSYIIINTPAGSKNDQYPVFQPDTYAKQIQGATLITPEQLSLALEDLSLAFTLGPIESGSLDADIQKTYPNPNYKYDTGDVQTFANALTQLPEFQLF